MRCRTDRDSRGRRHSLRQPTRSINKKIYTYSEGICETGHVRRKPGALVPLELAILELAAARGGKPFHGFELAKALAAAHGSRGLTAHGTLYKALGRLADQELLEDEWEDPEIALREGRPRRRLYRLTGAGVHRLAQEKPQATTPTSQAAFA
jgi:PadR family transcriptional regulator